MVQHTCTYWDPMMILFQPMANFVGCGPWTWANLVGLSHSSQPMASHWFFSDFADGENKTHTWFQTVTTFGVFGECCALW